MSDDWDVVDAALRVIVSAAWSGSSYSSIPLLYENDDVPDNGPFMLVDIEGMFNNSTPYGGVLKRVSVTTGIVFAHGFINTGVAKSYVIKMVETITKSLELRTFNLNIDFDGRNPPSPAYFEGNRDRLMQLSQPGGNYYRCSGSVSFIVRDRR